MLRKKLLLYLCLFSVLLSLISCDTTGEVSDELSNDTVLVTDPASGNDTGTSEPEIIDDSPYTFTHDTGLRIVSYFDGTETKIAANVFIPEVKREGQKLPAIVFINSWAMDEYEYVAQAAKFASKGYITISYSCRGWGQSEGVIKMGGKEDWADFSAVVDWLEDNTPVDVDNIGVSGISLGGGGSLHAISHDPRVKTVAALSSYIDAAKSLYSDDTPRLVWGFMLIATGTILGEMHQELYDVYFNTLTNTDIDWLREWAAERSPASYIDDLDKINKPVYMGHNFGDHMFRPDVTIDYFNGLTVDHKRLDMNQGTHATGEVPGLVMLPNYTYDNVHRWFDYWLKGIETGIIADKKKSAVVTMEVKHTGERVVFDTEDLKKEDGSYTWPPESTEDSNYYLGPRGLFSNGSLNVSPVNKNTSNKIYSGILTGAISGIPMLAQALEQFKIPVVTNINLISRLKAIVFTTDPLGETLKVRGTPEIDCTLSVSKQKGQVFFYLYDVDKYGTAKYITLGYKTFWDAVPGEKMKVKVTFISTAYDIKEGHRLALVMDTHNPEFGKPTLAPFDVKFYFSSEGSEQAVLKVTKKK